VNILEFRIVEFVLTSEHNGEPLKTFEQENPMSSVVFWTDNLQVWVNGLERKETRVGRSQKIVPRMQLKTSDMSLN
jgi:hypothetical protein